MFASNKCFHEAKMFWLIFEVDVTDEACYIGNTLADGCALYMYVDVAHVTHARIEVHEHKL